jgi:glycosyltransferase involved in cell wall biosynthesis
MKIVYVENVRIPSERAHAYQIVQMCAWLSKFGHEVTLVNPARSKSDKDVFAFFGLPTGLFRHVTLHSWDPLSWDCFPFKAITYGLQRAAFIRALRGWASKNQADAWYTRDPAMLDALRDRVRAPWLLELHDAPDAQADRWERIKDHVAGFVVISNGLLLKLVELGIPKEKILVAPDGYDPELMQPSGNRAEARRSLHLPDDAFVAMYAGSFYPWKGVDLVVGSWDKTPEHCHLVCIGGPEQDRLRVEALVKPAVSSRVHILPAMERRDVVNLYTAADLALLPSSPEFDIGRLYTSPLKLFEYLAAGLPILASDVPSSHEVLDDRTARFYEPTEDGFIKTLQQACNDRAWLERARTEAPIVVKPYTWEARSRAVESKIKTVVASFPYQAPSTNI